MKTIKFEKSRHWVSKYCKYFRLPFLSIIFLLITNFSKAQQVEVCKDINFSGGSLFAGPGTIVSCMDLTPRNTSFWGGFVDHGQPVRNDEISSIRVPKGLKITCWADCNFQGKSRVFTEDCANVGPEWNDIISSYKVERITPEIIVAKNGLINFRNNTGGILYFYFVLTDNNAVINFCSQRILYNNRAMPDNVSFTVPAGKILNYYFYTRTDCDGRFQKAYGAIASSQANGGTISIN